MGSRCCSAWRPAQLQAHLRMCPCRTHFWLLRQCFNGPHRLVMQGYYQEAGRAGGGAACTASQPHMHACWAAPRLVPLLHSELLWKQSLRSFHT